MSNHQYSLDIVIPCYNPDLGWEDKLIHYYQSIASQVGVENTSLILVNDGSTERVTSKQIERIKHHIPGLQYLEYPINKGKGHALRTGVSESMKELVIFTDVDFPYKVESVLSVYEELSKGTDVALGYREQDYYTKVPAFRKVLSKLLRWALRSLLKLSITDTQCGLKGFNAKGKSIFLSTTIKRFLFDLEFVMLSSRDSTISTKAVPVTLREGVVFSKVNIKVLFVELINFIGLTLSNRKPKSGE